MSHEIVANIGFIIFMVAIPCALFSRFILHPWVMSEKLGKDLPVYYLFLSNLLMFVKLNEMEMDAGEVMSDPQLVALRRFSKWCLVGALVSLSVSVVVKLII